MDVCQCSVLSGCKALKASLHLQHSNLADLFVRVCVCAGGPGRPYSPAPRTPGRPMAGPGASSVGLPPGGLRGPGSNPAMSRDYQRVLDTLQSLTPAEVDRLEAVVRAQAAGAAGGVGAGGVAGPSGLASTAPARR